jgi:hypothetical protein
MWKEVQVMKAMAIADRLEDLNRSMLAMQVLRVMPRATLMEAHGVTTLVP